MNRNIAVICAAIIIKTIERCLTVEHKGIHHLKEARLGGETHGWPQSCRACVCVRLTFDIHFVYLGHGKLHKNTFTTI